MQKIMSFPKFLKIAALHPDVKYIEINGERKVEKTIDDFSFQLIQTLSQKLNFMYEIIPPLDGEIGRSLANGNWTGMVGMIQRGDADAVISKLMMTEERANVVSFSYPFLVDDITFITQKPKYSPDPSTFLKPFTLDVWICIFVSFLFVVSMFHFVTRRRYDFGKVLLYLLSAFLQKTVLIRPKKSYECILFLFWVTSAGLLSYSYSALLLSFLTFPPLSGVRTIRELTEEVAKNKFHCVSYPGAYIGRVLLKSMDPAMYVIGRSLTENEGNSDVKGALENKTISSPTFLAARKELLVFQELYYISKDVFFLAIRAIATRKDFCCMAKLNDVIHRMWAGGLIEKLLSDYIYKKKIFKLKSFSGDDIESNGHRSLTIEDFEGPLLLLGAGYLCSTFVFAVEMVIYKYRYYKVVYLQSNLK